jgi:secreted trypsin-like serine protease
MKIDCGVRPLRPLARVVGGRNAHFGEWPWQVLVKEATWLGLFVKTKCGGVLIDYKWVIILSHTFNQLTKIYQTFHVFYFY